MSCPYYCYTACLIIRTRKKGHEFVFICVGEQQYRTIGEQYRSGVCCSNQKK